MSDEEVLDKAHREQRVLLTNDRGFGERARQVPLSPGPVILRLSAERGVDKVSRVLEVLPIIAPHMADHFVIVHDTQIRIVPLGHLHPPQAYSPNDTP